MFFWYKKRQPSGSVIASRIIRNFILGLLMFAVVGGIIFFFANSKDIIGTAELKALSEEIGAEYAVGNNEATITVNGITASVFECESATEASDIYEQYCMEYPKENAVNTQNINLGDIYCKYSASGSEGILIAARINKRVAIIVSDNISDEDEAKALFKKIVK